MNTHPYDPPSGNLLPITHREPVFAPMRTCTTFSETHLAEPNHSQLSRVYRIRWQELNHSSKCSSRQWRPLKCLTEMLHWKTLDRNSR
jgi:hypothetical protein